uniref:Tas retrotransposon peptidase A16 n=1 Tax=Haemonchus contortus TaxID=6289 RepID=A0A7I4Z2N9_HAECO
MDHILQILEDIITSEEMVSQYMKNETLSHAAGNGDKPKPPKFGPRQPCMYCEGSHKSFDCDKYATPRERSQYLREHKLCLICASPRHITANARNAHVSNVTNSTTLRAAFKERRKVLWHHHSKRAPDYKENSKFKGSSSRSKETNTGNSRMKVNYLSHHSNSVPPEGQTVLEVLPAKYQLKGQPTYLPTGEITALDPTTKSLRNISVLLDTGAEISFIDTALAAELHLPSINETRLRLHTFGSDHVHETISREVSLQAWDVEGRPFTLSLYTHEILTKPFETAPTCAENIEFILQHKLTVNFKEGGSTVKPSILISCDQLWTLITCNEPHIQLPSGLHLLPTRLGYIMTGQATSSLQEENLEKEKDKWDVYWTLEGQVNVTTLPDPQSETDENEKWDKLELEEKVPPEQVQEELSSTQSPNNDSEPTGTEHNPSSRILGGHYNLRPRKQRNYRRTVAISPTRQSHLLINILSILIIVIRCSCSSQLSGHSFQ